MASAGFHTISLVLILVSFVFLLLATISTPVVTAFDIGSTSNYNYGILGYCSTDGKSCPKATYPYTLSDKDKKIDWLLQGATRDTLAKIFILCPIACGFNLICLVLIIVGHFASSGFLIISVVVNIISFIITTLIAVVVIVVFMPEVSWTGWILIGAGAANLLSIVFLFLGWRFSKDTTYDNESVDELNHLDDKFNHTTMSNSTFMPPSSGYKKYDDNGSINKDYEFKPLQQNSSIYNSNPQLANDFTQHSKPSTHSFGSRTLNSNKSHYEDAQVNFVNGPNTPISSKQQMAPTFTPNVATPTTNDVPRSNVPYPPNGPLNRPPYNKSVFEHHPEVEGHRPFTELGDDPQFNRGSEGSDEILAGSDASSDFTSVSQRAVNPRYQQQQQYNDPSYFPQQQPQYESPYPQQQPFQPQFQQQQAPPPPQQFQQQPPPMNMGMNTMPMQARYARPVPTASDNALANNPDFALGSAAGRKKAPFGRPNGGPRYQGQRRDGPYGMI